VNYFCKNHNNPNSLEQILLNRFQAFLINSGIVSGIQIKFNEEYGVAELHAKVDDKMSNIVDIGYGISLLLPILFEAFMNFTQKNILIEQPEIHIHPKLQCDLISALISVLGNNRIIIETHSPFIIQKLQVMVKNSDFGLKSDDVKIYYFKRGTLGSSISEHVINENGLLQPVFPKGFYDISYDLTRQLM
jgi:predicted ATPase